ncbi:MAG: DUF3795 domain-containing protein [Candidatus Bathyarchaeota archaeon]|nr:DUF3795 domain-containing protein [Candidatus Bathyarchaeota archaeon]MDH5792341.1 DUF3795 domain-containing protein [Candidatus Bathyarchaeota archaeon]
MVCGLIFSVCGTICDDCEYHRGEKEPKCPGCEAIGGKPFWGECPTYHCTEERGVEHCGLCGEFPCERFIEMFDPSHGQVSSVIRAGILAYRARHGDDKAVELVRKIEG